MQIFLIALALSFFTFLYSIFSLSREDFILLRKNISLEQMFNISFVGLIVVLFFSRLGFVLQSPSIGFLNPLVFLAFPYFPGLSFSGGIIGGIVYLWFVHHTKKLPLGRLSDIVLLAFIFGVSTYLCIIAVEQIIRFRTIFILQLLQWALISIEYSYLLWTFGKGKWKDGSLGAFGIALCCLFLFLTNFFVVSKRTISFQINIENILLSILAVGFFIVFGYIQKHKRK